MSPGKPCCNDYHGAALIEMNLATILMGINSIATSKCLSLCVEKETLLRRITTQMHIALRKKAHFVPR